MNKERIVIDFAYLTMCAENDYIYETGEAKALLDYITNLQQQNKELQKRIEFLEWDRNDKKGIENDYLDLKEKIDKAIEYMKLRFMNCIDNDKRYFEDYYIQEIYEILKDSDVDDNRDMERH